MTAIGKGEELAGGCFPTTHWSLVARAAGRGGAGADGAAADGEQREALGRLLRQYLPALRAYLKFARGLSADDADDVLQSFVAEKVLEDGLVGHADRARGRFRTYLKSVLTNFWLNRLRAARAAHRRPAGGAPASLESDGVDLADGGARPDDPMDVEWARGVLARVLERMRGACAASGRADVWGVFEDRVANPCLRDLPPVPYAELVARYGLASPAQASNVLVTGTRTFVRTLKEVIGEYEDDPAEVEREISDLREILSRGRARLD